MIRRLKAATESFEKELKVYELVLRHPKTPKLSKWLLGIAAAYFVSPIDLIPDFIPILGQLDDLLIVPGLAFLAIKMIPKDIILECRLKAE